MWRGQKTKVTGEMKNEESSRSQRDFEQLSMACNLFNEEVERANLIWLANEFWWQRPGDYEVSLTGSMRFMATSVFR